MANLVNWRIDERERSGPEKEERDEGDSVGTRIGDTIGNTSFSRRVSLEKKLVRGQKSTRKLTLHFASCSR